MSIYRKITPIKFLKANPIDVILGLTSLICFSLGLMGLVGWYFFIPHLVNVSASQGILHYETALSLVFISFLVGANAFHNYKIAIALGSIVSLFFFLRLLSVLYGWQSEWSDAVAALVGIDASFRSEAQMAFWTFISLGSATVVYTLSPFFQSRLMQYCQSLLGSLLFGSGFVAVFNYIFGNPEPITWAGFSDVSIFTAIAISCLGIGALALGFKSKKKLQWFKRPELALCFFLVVETLGIGLYFSTKAITNFQIKNSVQNHAENLQIAIVDNVSQNALAIKRMADRWQYEEGLSEIKWHADARNYLRDLGLLFSLAWINQDMIVSWLEPKSLEPLLLNKNLGIEKNRQSTMWRARIENDIFFTEAVEMYSGGDGTIIFAPIFRHSKFLGYIGAAFRHADLFTPYANKLLRNAFSLAVSENQKNIFHQNIKISTEGSSYKTEIPIRLKNLNWTMQLKPSDEFIRNEGGTIPLQFLKSSTIAALILGLMFRLVQAAHKNRRSMEAISNALSHKNDELRIARSLATEANATKSLFLANMSHEIRTPLSIIIGFTDLLDSSHDDETMRKQYIGAIQKSGKNLLALVNDILDLAKVEAGKIDLVNEVIELLPFLNDITSSFRPLLQGKDVALKLETHPPIPKTITSDRARLRQIITNLISNAVKFTDSGKISVSISSHKKRYSTQLRLEISDTGCGISKDRQTKVFEPFVQGNDNVSRNYSGTGLGLALSKKLAKNMGGDLFLEYSRPDEGSRFVLTLDAGEIFEGAINRKLTKHGDQEVPDVLDSAQLKGLWVLVADDNADIVIFLSTLLRNAGAEVDAVTNGEECICMALKNHYDVILMDLRMPNMSGEEAVRKLRSLNYKRPILAVSATALKGQKQKCLEMGFTEFMSKPIQPQLLVKNLRVYQRAKS